MLQALTVPLMLGEPLLLGHTVMVPEFSTETLELLQAVPEMLPDPEANMENTTGTAEALTLVLPVDPAEPLTPPEEALGVPLRAPEALGEPVPEAARRLGEDEELALFGKAEAESRGEADWLVLPRLDTEGLQAAEREALPQLLTELLTELQKVAEPDT